MTVYWQGYEMQAQATVKHRSKSLKEIVNTEPSQTGLQHYMLDDNDVALRLGEATVPRRVWW